ncbi:hypothetical protein X975_25246, partial [Stegodyphus mimosarum]
MTINELMNILHLLLLKVFENSNKLGCFNHLLKFHSRCSMLIYIPVEQTEKKKKKKKKNFCPS